MEFRSTGGRRSPPMRFKSGIFFRVLVVTLLFAALSFTPIFSAKYGGSSAPPLRRRDISSTPAEVGAFSRTELGMLVPLMRNNWFTLRRRLLVRIIIDVVM
jgi:hypothetical protein